MFRNTFEGGKVSCFAASKLMIALALLRQHDVFLADEPFTGLDPKQIHGFKQILQELKQQDKAILISTYLLDLAESICDKYIFLHDGKILAEGSKADVIKHGHLDTELSLEELYMLLTEGGEYHAYKMLCLNRFRGYKRLINNMLQI